MSKQKAKLEHAWFSRAEMQRRWKSARKRMEAQGIDALLVSGEENFQYLVGTSASLALHHSLTRPSLFILPLEHPPIVITQSVSNLEGTCYVTDVRSFDDLLEFPLAPIVEALNETVGSDARVGVELGQEQRMGMPVAGYLALTKKLAKLEFVDAAPILIALRMRKSPEELVYMREAAAVTARARQRLFDEVRIDMTERQVVRRMRQLILEEGGDRTGFVILQHDDPGARNQFPLDRKLQPNTVLAVDGGAYVGMYTIDYVRMAMLGKATDEHHRWHQAVLEVVDEMKAALRPGITCSQLHALSVRAIESKGGDALDPRWKAKGRVGHGQGILITEPPSLCMEDTTMLEPGMVISTEPMVRKGDIQFQWEDVHVITETGYEQLTQEPTTLREIAV